MAQQEGCSSPPRSLSRFSSLPTPFLHTHISRRARCTLAQLDNILSPCPLSALAVRQIPLSPPSLTSTNHHVCLGLLLGAARGMLLAAAFPFPLFFAPHTFSSHPYFAACEVHACAARQYIVSLSPIGARCKANPSFSANQILNRTPKSGLGFSLLKTAIAHMATAVNC